MLAKRHMERVADWGRENGCACCGEPMAHLHHLLADRTPGRKSSDWLVIPLCLECHVLEHGIHGDRGRWKLRKMSETQALAIVLEGVYGN